MKALIASIAALGLVASPALAATTPAPTTTTSTAKQAKAEGESAKTEAKEKAAAHRHHAAACSCPKVAKAHHKMMKKSTKTASVTKKTAPAKTKG